MLKVALAANLSAGDTLVLEFLGGEIVLCGLSVVIAVIILIIILPSGMILLPLVIDSGLIDRGVLERASLVGEFIAWSWLGWRLGLIARVDLLIIATNILTIVWSGGG